MGGTVAHPAVVGPRLRYRRLWVLTVLFFGIGDVVTSGIGLSMAGIAEIGPLVAPLVSAYGLWAMVALKIVFIGAALLFWRVGPKPQADGIPLGLAVLGVLVTGWNIVVVLSVLG